ncbi:MAG: hypothetical protein L0G70_05195, partial [Rubrobacter sp.]|nr:hypothetical protein [Rubrobacter sp.]
VHKADLAMYGAKNDGKSGMQVFIAGSRRSGARLYMLPSNGHTPSSNGDAPFGPGAARLQHGDPDASLDAPCQ